MSKPHINEFVEATRSLARLLDAPDVEQISDAVRRVKDASPEVSIFEPITSVNESAQKIWVQCPRSGFKVRSSLSTNEPLDKLKTMFKAWNVSSLYRWGNLVRDEQEIKTPPRNGRFFDVSALIEIAFEEFSFTEKVLLAFKQKGIEFAADKKLLNTLQCLKSDESHPSDLEGVKFEDIRVLLANLMTRNLAARVGYDGDSKLGLLGAIERFEIDVRDSAINDVEALGAEYRNEGVVAGNVLTAKFLKEQYGISGKWLSIFSEQAEQEQRVVRRKVGKKYAYLWAAVLRLKKEARQRKNG